jgi:universal stress protein A
MKLQSILIPTDLSDVSLTAFPWAQQMAQNFGAKLDLVHVLERPQDVPWWLGEQEYHARRGTLEAEAHVHLQELQDRYLANLPVEQHLRAGHPGEQIVEAAIACDADLIIMGTHGRGMSRLLFGSVADYVVRHAYCPVLTLRDRS